MQRGRALHDAGVVQPDQRQTQSCRPSRQVLTEQAPEAGLLLLLAALGGVASLRARLLLVALLPLRRLALGLGDLDLARLGVLLRLRLSRLLSLSLPLALSRDLHPGPVCGGTVEQARDTASPVSGLGAPAARPAMPRACDRQRCVAEVHCLWCAVAGTTGEGSPVSCSSLVPQQLHGCRHQAHVQQGQWRMLAMEHESCSRRSARS